MPLTLILTEGVLPVGKEKEAIAQITDSLLKWSNLTGNKVMTPNVVGHVTIMAKGTTFSGGKEFSGAWAEWKLPSFALTDRKAQIGHLEDVTNIIYNLSGGKQPKENIYVNVVHALDGAWNFNGKALTNEEIFAEVNKG